MTEKNIYNCHIHIFTHENIPNRFLPFLLVPATRITPLRWLLTLAMETIIPWSKKDIFHRYSNFMNITYSDDQEENLKNIMNFYPPNTQFIVLPMDMEGMGKGKVIEDIDAQHKELARLFKKYSDTVIPFAHIDPRKDGAFNRLQRLVEKNGFKGVKIYPPHGYPPTHPTLMNDIYPYMVEKNIPLITHCMPGPEIINSGDISEKDAIRYTEPGNYKAVMEKHPNLKICLGHFGGIDAWKKYLKDESEPTWLTTIIDLMRDYPNLYADISYTISNFEESVQVLSNLLENQEIADRILFGTDYFMIENERHSEEGLYEKLKSRLGDEKFWKIAYSNPRNFLSIKETEPETETETELDAETV